MSDIVVGALIALGGTIVGALIGYLAQLRVQENIDRRERRASAFAVLGETRALLDNLSPDTWAMWGSSDVDLFKTHADLWSQTRPRFIALRSLYPNQADDIEQAYTTINKLRVEVSLLMEAVRKNRDIDKLRERAVESYETGVRLVNDLMETVGQ